MSLSDFPHPGSFKNLVGNSGQESMSWGDCFLASVVQHKATWIEFVIVIVNGVQYEATWVEFVLLNIFGSLVTCSICVLCFATADTTLTKKSCLEASVLTSRTGMDNVPSYLLVTNDSQNIKSFQGTISQTSKIWGRCLKKRIIYQDFI